MNNKKMYKKIILLPLGLALFGCNKDEGNNSTSVAPPVTQSEIIYGMIENIDPTAKRVNVANRLHNYESSTFQNRDFDDTLLTPGTQVKIHTDLNGGQEISPEPTLSGFISNIDINSKSFIVNGTNLTFSSLDPSIHDGDFVLVFSMSAPDGTHKVMNVVKTNNMGAYTAEIEGQIASINDKILTLNTGVTIESSNAQVEYSNLLEIGQWINAYGTYQQNQFIASLIEIDSYDQLGNSHTSFSIEGIVSHVASDRKSFTLDNRGRFSLNELTTYSGGNNSSLSKGQQIKINAKSSTDGNVAEQVTFGWGWRPGGFGFDFDDIFEMMYEFKCIGSITSFQNKVIGIQCNYAHGANLAPGTSIQVQTSYMTEYDNIWPSQLRPGSIIKVEGYKNNGKYVADEVGLPYD